MTLRILLAKARAVGLRKLATREAFEGVLTILQSRPRVNIQIWANALRNASSRSTWVTSARLLRLFAICGPALTALEPASASAICSPRLSIVSPLSSPLVQDEQRGGRRVAKSVVAGRRKRQQASIG